MSTGPKATSGRKVEIAADQFFGFYLLNVRSRPNYCRSLGVDIAPFVDAFKRDHSSLYAKAREIQGRGRYSADEIEAKLFEMLQPTFQKVLSDDMAGMAAMLGSTQADACKFMAENGAELASNMQLAKTNPALYEALLQSR